MSEQGPAGGCTSISLDGLQSSAQTSIELCSQHASPVITCLLALVCPLPAPLCSFPIPFIIAGRWCLPLPAPTGLRFVIGQPIRAPKPAKEGEPSQAEVDAFHAQFYASLKVRT